MEQIIDIGVNLMHKQFDADRQTVMEAALEEMVTPLIITGTNLKESIKAAEYARKYPKKLYSTAGVHPHDAKGCNENTIGELRKLAALEQVCAIGECGLDYDRNFSPPDTQRYYFEEQLKLAQELDMPVFLHERSAFEDFRSILSKYPSVCKKSVVHCFTGTGKQLQTYLSMGCLIGITGFVCDERRGQSLRSLLRMIPLNRLMIETDAPFLIPRNRNSQMKNGRNEPQYLRHIVKDISKCMGRKEEEVARATTQNAKEFFGLE